MMEAIQHQLPLTEPASSEQTSTTQSLLSVMFPLMVVKSGLLQTALYPRNRASQAKAKDFLNCIAQRSTNPFTTSIQVEPSVSLVLSDNV